MDEKNRGLIILVVVLFLFVIGLGSFIVYDKMLNDKPIENANNNEIINNQENKNDIPIENTDDNEIINNQENKTDYNNSYELFAQNLKSQFSKYDDNNKSYFSVDSDFVDDGFKIYLTKDQTLFIEYFNKELNAKYGEYKIADNVLSFNVVEVGQGGGHMLYFINEDGTVGSADIEYGVALDNQIIIKKDIGYKNIVSIISGTFGDGFVGVHGPIFIDINGNIFSQNLE